jgi:small subunit ribosomal protein S4
MGDPRRIRSKYEGPRHPWERERLDEERVTVKEYGLKNKKELWKALAKLKHFSYEAKRLVNIQTEQAEKERKQILERAFRIGLLPRGSSISDMLGLTIKDILNRRLQTIVFKKGLARTINQARQMIVHRHISVSGKKITVPSYYVLLSEEPLVNFMTRSPFTDEMHPERTSAKASPQAKRKAEEKPAEKSAKPEQKEKAAEAKTEAKKAKPKEEKPKSEKKGESKK